MEEPAKTRQVGNTAANARVVGREKDVKVSCAGGGAGVGNQEKGDGKCTGRGRGQQAVEKLNNIA